MKTHANRATGMAALARRTQLRRRIHAIAVACFLLFGVNAAIAGWLADANTRFGFELLRELIVQTSDENLFVSPASVSMALAMTYNGAAGTTREAMAETLRISGMDLAAVNEGYAALLADLSLTGSDVDLAIANSIWAKEGFGANPTFIDRNREFFDAEVQVLPFDDLAIDAINQWVNDATRSKIPSVLQPPIPDAAVMYLINAIYFSAFWEVQFVPEETGISTFYLPSGDAKEVAMMFREGSYPYLRGEGFQAVRLAYTGDRLSMYVFLPNRESTVDAFLKRLTPEHWEHWLGEFHDSGNGSWLYLPRFHMELTYVAAMEEALTALGMGVAFQPGVADFSGIADGLYISRVIHKTFIEVKEAGTEAAAATVVESGITSNFPPMLPLMFLPDRPFVFVIHDSQADMILFLGTVTEPDDPPDDLTKVVDLPIEAVGPSVGLKPAGKRLSAWGEIKRP